MIAIEEWWSQRRHCGANRRIANNIDGKRTHSLGWEQYDDIAVIMANASGLSRKFQAHEFSFSHFAALADYTQHTASIFRWMPFSMAFDNPEKPIIHGLEITRLLETISAFVSLDMLIGLANNFPTVDRP